MSIFEGEFGDSGFIEFAKSFRDHLVVLLFCRASERKIETEAAREIERDAAVFRRVRRREKTTVLAILHIFAIGL